MASMLPPLPHNVELEERLLGAMLLDPETAERIVKSVSPEVFHDSKRRTIFNAIASVARRGERPDPTTVAYEIGEDRILSVGGPVYLSNLIVGTTIVAAADQHGRMLTTLSRRRALIRLCLDVAQRASAANGNGEETLASVAVQFQGLFDEARPGGGRFVPLPLAEIQQRGIPPIEWHLPDWLTVRDICLIAGAAGIGKSTLAAAIAVAAAAGSSWCGIPFTTPVPVLYFDEEQDDQTTARLFIRLGAPHLNLKVFSGQGLRFDLPEGIEALEGLIRETEAKLVVLDSVQQIFGSVDENSATAVGAVYRELFRLRDRYGVTFILVLDHLSAWGSTRQTPVRVGEVIPRIRAVCQRYDVGRIVGDPFGAEPLKHALQKAGLTFEERPFTIQSKGDLYGLLRSSILDRSIELLDHRESLREIRALEIEHLPGGQFRVGHPNRAGVRDNLAIVIALVLQEAASYVEAGEVVVSRRLDGRPELPRELQDMGITWDDIRFPGFGSGPMDEWPFRR